MATAVENLLKHIQLAVRQTHKLLARQNSEEELLQIYYYEKELHDLIERLLTTR